MEMLELVNHLNNQIKKYGKLGCLRSALRKNTIEELRDGLKSSVSTLLFSYSIYKKCLGERNSQLIMHLYEENTQMIMQEIQKSQNTILTTIKSTECQQKSGSSARTTGREIMLPRPSRLDKSGTSYHKRTFNLPRWLTSSVWELSSRRALGQWTTTLRSYYIAPMTSPIIRACMSHDIAEVRRLFSDRLATPFDRQEGGWSLLHAACIDNLHDEACYEFCKYLIDAGADVDALDNGNRSVMYLVGICADAENPDLVAPISRLIMAHAEIDFSVFDITNPLVTCTSVAMMESLGKLVDWTAQYPTLKERLEFAAGGYWWDESPSMFRSRLGSDPLDPTVLKTTFKSEELRKCVLPRLMWLLGEETSHQHADVVENWPKVVEGALRHEFELSTLLPDPIRKGHDQTLLMFFLKGYAADLRHQSQEKMGNMASSLQIAGD